MPHVSSTAAFWPRAVAFLLLAIPYLAANNLPINGITVTDHVPNEVKLNPDKFIVGRNIMTREVFVKDLTVLSEPTPVRRVRLMFSTSKTTSQSQTIDIFHMRLRWLDPDMWGDNFKDESRSYTVLCEIEDEDTGHARTYLALTMEAVFNGYDERYIFPRMKLVARCKIRARNGAGLNSEWVMSPTIRLYDLFDPPLTTIDVEKPVASSTEPPFTLLQRRQTGKKAKAAFRNRRLL